MKLVKNASKDDIIVKNTKLIESYTEEAQKLVLIIS